MRLEFVFATAAEARAFLQGVEYVNDGSCFPLEVIERDGLAAALIEDEDTREEDLVEFDDDATDLDDDGPDEDDGPDRE